MSLVDKVELLKILRAINAFDYGSPFIGVYVDEPLTFYRSSPFGFIQSVDRSIAVNPTYVSLTQLQERLRILPEECVEIDTDPSGVLVISSIDNTFFNELRVHTVAAAAAGMKEHAIGNVGARLDPKLFAGFNAKPFQVVSNPFLKKGKIMLPTVNGIVTWQGPTELEKLSIQPRDTFLKFLSSGVEEIYITDKGYWGAKTDKLLVFLGAHTGSDLLFNTYDVVGTKLATFPAKRLLQALHSASSIVTGNITMKADEIVTKDAQGSVCRFGVGGAGAVIPFNIFSKAAKLIVDALEQATDEEVTLYSITVGGHSTMRLERGNWSCSFKTF
jgi:hypothetical protein